MQKLTTKTKVLIIGLCSSILFSCNEEEVTETEKLTSVTTQHLSELITDYHFKRPARVISINDSTLSTELNTPVSFIHARVGDSVKKGAPLVELDCRDDKNRLKQAAAQLSANKASAKLSELNYQRGIQIYTQKSISEQEMNRLESEFEQAKANTANAQAVYTIAKSNVRKCIIRAPFNAIVMERTATVGQLATPGTAMVRIIDSDNLEVSANLIGHEANSIQESPSVYFQYNEQKYPLNIRALTPAVDSVRRTQQVRLEFAKQKTMPGVSGELVWKHPLLVLPTEYLSKREGQLGVLYANQTNNNKALVAFYPIKGAREGQPAPIRLDTELNNNTAILIDNRFGLNIGQEVEIKNTSGNTQ